MQPTAQTGIVWKISIFLFILLAVVLYKMNDYFKQEKYTLAQTQLRTQIVSVKTSVSSQLSTLKKVLSSYEYDMSESKINWVQLDPFFGIAKGQRVSSMGVVQYRITQYIGRSGSLGASWNASFLQNALSKPASSSEGPIVAQVFQNGRGEKFMSLCFANPNGQAVIVVGGADYFQKYFDLSRGGRMTALLETDDHILAAHSEADYLGSQMDEGAVSPKKFLVEKEEIAGTNLTAMNFVSRSSLAKGFVVPWSVVGLIIGFGLLIIGVLIYTLEPIERRIEKYRMQEREQVYKDTLSDALVKVAPLEPAPPKLGPLEDQLPPQGALSDEPPSMSFLSAPAEPQTATDLVKAMMESKPLPVAPKDVELPPSPIAKTEPARATNPPPPPVQVLFPPTPPAITSESRPDTAAEPQINFDETFIPAKKKAPSVYASGSLVLDSSQVETFDYAPGGTAELDLEKALSLDEAESEEAQKESIKFVQENLTSKSINTTAKVSDMAKPDFEVRGKNFRVESIDVPIRRPERS